MYIPFISRRSETRCQATHTASTGPNTSIYSFRLVHMILIAQLVRLHALPCYIYFYLYGSLDASPFVPPKALLYTLIVISDWLYQLCGSAMILNDILDGKIDVTVPQSRNRPIARGAITPLQGYMWIVYHVLCFIATIMWVGLPDEYLWLSLLHMLLEAAFHPAQRFTDFTPCVIAPAWAFDLFAGAAAVGLDPFRRVPWLRSWIGKGASTREAYAMLWCLDMAYTCSGVLLKSIHTHQDVGRDTVAKAKGI